MSNTVEMKYYCPLTVNVFEENEYGETDDISYELDGRFADSYEYEIRERLSEYCDDLDMAEYFNADHKNIHKLKEVKWDVESVDGTLYGCITATLTDYFTDEEEETFKDWVRFYAGYVASEHNPDYFPSIVIATMKSIIRDSENRYNRNLYRIAIEMSMLMNVMAATMDIPKDSLDKLRGECEEEVKRINGTLSLDTAVKWQS